MRGRICVKVFRILSYVYLTHIRPVTEIQKYGACDYDYVFIIIIAGVLTLLLAILFLFLFWPSVDVRVSAFFSASSSKVQARIVGEMRWQHPGLCPKWSRWSDPSKWIHYTFELSDAVFSIFLTPHCHRYNCGSLSPGELAHDQPWWGSKLDTLYMP